MIVGASLGAASAAVAEDAAPEPVPTIYYDACHTLLYDSTIPSDVPVWSGRSLAVLAELVTRGESIPSAVATALNKDEEEVSNQVRVAVRNDIQSLTTCAVAPTPTQAEATADEFAMQLLAFEIGEATGDHQARVAAASGEAASAQACVDDAQGRIDAAIEFDALADARIEKVELERCNSDLYTANRELNELASIGAAVVPLETLESASAAEISEHTYNSRLRSGAAGANIEVGIGDSIGAVGTVSSSSSFGLTVPDGPAPRAGVGAVLGAALGFGFVLFTERLDSKLRSKTDVETTLDLPVLAEIPPLGRSDRRSTRILTLEEPRSRTAESFRALRSALDYARRVDEDHGRARPGAQVVLVTSAGPNEGKTTTVANLATVMAEGDRRVLAVNCDFRRPRLHRYLGGTANPRHLNITDVPGVQLVTQVTENDGDATPSDVIAAQQRLVARAREQFDVIILDTAPILTTNDAADLLGVTDQVVLIVNASETKAESAALASELLERRGRAPLGVALVAARDVPNASDYYYDDNDPYLEPTGRRRGSNDDSFDAVAAPSR